MFGSKVFRYFLTVCYLPAGLANISTGALACLNRALSVSIEDSYFDALQSVSPSRWILYESMTLNKPEDFGELNKIWRPFLDRMAWKHTYAKGSIQVTGPAGYGKSALVKLILQEIMQRSPVVIIDYFLCSYGRSPPSLYDVYVSFIHRILSRTDG